jgi:hypothetical protein
MRKSFILFAALFAAALPALFAAPAQAQATRTWVSGVGDDANPCSRTAPCKTFAGAISKTAANGEISVLDSGGFGAINITKSISIVSEGAEGSILASGTNGVIVNGANIVVNLRNILIEGTGSTNGVNGIRFINGAALHVQNCQIRTFTSGGGDNENGILFAPTGPAELTVTDCFIANNGSLTGGAGILIKPAAGGSAKVTISGTTVSNNRRGIVADGSASTGTISVAVTDSVVAGNSLAGFVAVSTAAGAVTKMMIQRSTSAMNAVGANVAGTSATMRLGHSVITGNGTATQINNGTMASFGTNHIEDNTAVGDPPTVIPAK